MEESNHNEKTDQTSSTDKNQNHAHFQVLNKTKSTINKSNLFLNFNSPPIITNNTNKEIPHESHAKEITFGAPFMSPQKKKSPTLYQVREGDTFESISSKFNIPTNWLIKQNVKQLQNSNFSLSENIQLNVTAPSPSIIKPLDCSFIRNKTRSDSESDSFTNDAGEPGIAYVDICENSFDFIPNQVGSANKPFHIKLASINEDVIVFTPKAHRDRLQKQQSKQNSKEPTIKYQPVKPAENAKNNNYQNISELASAITEQLVENALKFSSNEIQNPSQKDAEHITIEKIEETTNADNNASEHITIEKLEETSNATETISETIQQLQTNSQESSLAPKENDIILKQLQITKEDSGLDENSANSDQNTNVILNTKEKIKDQNNVEGEQTRSFSDQNSSSSSKETPNQKNNEISSISQPLPQNTQELESTTENTQQKDDKSSVLVVSFKVRKNDQVQYNTIYFRVRKEEGNEFSVQLQKAIKEAKLKIKSKKPAKIPIPQPPPPSSHISNSASSPLNFFQSIFNTIKDSFSHLNESDTSTNNNNNNNTDDNDNGNTQQKDLKPTKSNLYRRSYSEKTISNSLGLPFITPFNKNNDKKDGQTDDSLKPRRYSHNGDIPSSTSSTGPSSLPKRRVLAASVLLQIKIIDGPSAIFERNEEIDEIRSKLPYRMRSYDWMLIYRLSRDGSSFTNFFNYTRNSGPIVFIMSTSTKERIGAFIPTGFKYSTKYYGSGEAFVFRFVKQGKEKNENENDNKQDDNKNESENNNDGNKNENDEKEKNEKETEIGIEEKEGEKIEKEENVEDINQSNNEKNIEKVESEANKELDLNENSFAHIEAFKWTPGTNTNFMMSEKDTIIIGIGDDKDSYNQNDIDTINSSNGHMSGPAIWIGQDLQYASSSPCSTFSSPQLTKKNYFYVDDIEIWKIGFFAKK